MISTALKIQKWGLSLGFTAILLPVSVNAQNKTPDNWNCLHRVGGSWTFGVAPAGCDASSFGEDKYVTNTFLPVIFDEKTSSSSERLRYMDELAAVLKESATIYIKKRKPTVSSSEVSAFVHATYTMAHQESYWSHFRNNSDNRLKMMRGDSGHGHGLMQIDDRWHFVDIKQGVGWNLTDNIIASFELYYNAWEQSAKSSCVTRPDDFRARARGAYAVYNGGSSKVCRWTNPNDKWAANDKGFVNKFDQQSWKPYIQNPGKKTLVNLTCLMDGQENCPLRSTAPITPVPKMGQVYETSNKELCVYKENSFSCVSQPKDLACLQNWVGGTLNDIVPMGADFESQEKREILDRHELCLNKTNFNLRPMGTILKTKSAIHLRATPAGNPILTIPLGSVIQVIDFEARNQAEGDRYYKVQWKNKIGFIYSGTTSTQLSWTELSTDIAKEAQMARPNQSLKITHAGGLNMRDAIGSNNTLVFLPLNSLVKVNQVFTRGDSNELYYKVTYAGKTGYIYSGHALPQSTINDWTLLINK